MQCGPRGLQGTPDNLYHNNGDGTFTDVSKKAGVDDGEGRYGLTSIWSDFDNDGKLDLFVTNDGEANYLYQGDGKGKFTDVGLLAGVAANEDGFEQANMGVAVGDYLHTGRMSLLISHFDNEYAALYRNDGGMNFTDTSIVSGIARGTQGYVGWGDAFVDFANNGWQDYLSGEWACVSTGGQRPHRGPFSGAEAAFSKPAQRDLREHQQASRTGACRFRR